MIRFYRRLKIAPGVRLNLGLHGVSATIGPRGLGYTRRLVGTPRRDRLSIRLAPGLWWTRLFGGRR